MSNVTYFCILFFIISLTVMMVGLIVMKLFLFVVYKATGGKKSFYWYWKHMKI